MSRSGAFCPECGTAVEREEPRSGQPLARASGPEESDDGDYDAEGSRTEESPAEEPRDSDAVLCTDCYLDRFDLVDAPDRIELRVCSQCGAVHRGNRWVDVGAEDYTDVAVDAVTEALGVHVDADAVSWQVAPEQVDPTTIRMHCGFTGEVRGTTVSEEVTVPVKIGRETCDRCGRIAGGSFASTVQVRAADREPTDAELERAKTIAHDLVADLEADGDREAFVTEVAEVDGGLDVKLSTTHLGERVARRVVDEFGGEYTDSERLITEDEDGNEVYRLSYAVRLPAYRQGEIIDPEAGDGPVLVRSVRGNLKGTGLATGDRYEAAFEAGDAPEARRLGWREDAQRTTLVAVEDDHAVQVLDPETFEAQTVPRPDYLDPDADEVSVFKSRAGLHVLPDEIVDPGSE
ncbi:MAG: 60S ribosomal export protein NMD3 [Haloarculaceae archaeon]